MLNGTLDRLAFRKFMERAKGIEPSASAWEAEVLPLYDARSGQEAAF